MRKYPLSLRLAHWISALLFVAVFGAVWFTWLGEPKVRYGLHKSLGLLVFVLVLIRVCIRLKSERPALVVENTRHARLVKLGHRGLYLLMGLVPVTMLIPAMLTRGVDFFDWHFEPVADNPVLAGAIKMFHIPLAYLLVAVIVGHIGMALYHHFWRKDGTLRRMV